LADRGYGAVTRNRGGFGFNCRCLIGVCCCWVLFFFSAWCLAFSFRFLSYCSFSSLFFFSSLLFFILFLCLSAGGERGRIDGGLMMVLFWLVMCGNVLSWLVATSSPLELLVSLSIPVTHVRSLVGQNQPGSNSANL